MNGWRARFSPAAVLPRATPRMLAWVRIVISAILLLSALWEDLPSIALLPPAQREPLGVLAVIEAATGGAFAWLCRTPAALAVLQNATCLALLAALVGWRARFSAAAGAVLYLLTTGLLREYSSFYHTGLVPMYALAVLAWSPCGEAWSVDRWRAQRAGRAVPPDDVPRVVDAWAVYAVWIVVAVSYVMAGVCKLRAGPGWCHPLNIQAILLVDALTPMQFSFDFTKLFLALPGWMFTLGSAGAVAGELGMGAVLVWPRARAWVPWLMVAMHVGIWLFQRVLFFDLILIQAIFLAPAAWFGRGSPASETAFASAVWPRPILALLVAFGVISVTRLEWYPISDMHMYSSVDTAGVIRYPQVFAQLASGQVVEGRPEKVIRAMDDARYRRLLRLAKKDAKNSVVVEFFTTCGRLHNARAATPAERIVAFEVVWRSWDFAHHPTDPERGKVSKRVRFAIPP